MLRMANEIIIKVNFHEKFRDVAAFKEEETFVYFLFIKNKQIFMLIGI